MPLSLMELKVLRQRLFLIARYQTMYLVKQKFHISTKYFIQHLLSIKSFSLKSTHERLQRVQNKHNKKCILCCLQKIGKIYKNLHSDISSINQVSMIWAVWLKLMFDVYIVHPQLCLNVEVFFVSMILLQYYLHII